MAKEVVIMLLANDWDSCLYVLTQKLAKPAVPFGGKYRIIDFPFSNCVNSGVDTVGILTQYQLLVLNEYIGNGQPWDLDRLYGGVHILPPCQEAPDPDWYEDTTNTIYQNISLIERYNPRYIVILSGDQIYKQDYSDFLRLHREKGAEFSVAIMEMPWEDVPRLELMVADGDDRVAEFQEKPENPESNPAPMDIYVSSWDIPRQYFMEGEADPDSEDDFGNSIIPNLPRDERGMYAYRFNGYWKGVGTISSLWEVSMEVLDLEHSDINLSDEDWKIYSRNSSMTGHKVSDDALVENSTITNGCRIDDQIRHSIPFSGVKVEAGAQVEDAVVMGSTTIKSDAVIKHRIVAENVVIGENAVIGAMSPGSEKGMATASPNIGIGLDVKIGPSTMVKNNVKGGEEQ